MTTEAQATIRWPQRALARAAARQAELKHAVRVSAAVGAAFAVSALLHLPQGYWTVFTAVIVVQTSIGATLTAGMERLLGTLVGGAVGVAGAYLRAKTVLEEGLVLSGAVALLAFAQAVRPNLRVAPITAAIVLVGGSSTHMDPLIAATWRVIEILIGSVIGLAATVLIFPARARRAVAERTARTMGLVAELLQLFARQLQGEDIREALHQSHQASRRAMALVEQAAGEAARESQSGLSGTAAPEGMVRSLLRVRSDAVMVGRALGQPMPDAVREVLEPSAVELLAAMAAALRDGARALRAGAAPDPSPLVQPLAAFEEAVERVRQARLTAELGFDAAARVFGLVFALESLLHHLRELDERIGEVAHKTEPVQAGPAGAP